MKIRTLLASGIACLFALPANAQMTHRDILASAKPIIFDGPNGSQYFLLDRHDLSDGMPVASVIIQRSDDGRTLMDIGLYCGQMGYTYLAMDHGPFFDLSAEGLAKLASQSEAIASTGLQSLTMSPITDDPYDAPLLGLYGKICGE